LLYCTRLLILVRQAKKHTFEYLHKFIKKIILGKKVMDMRLKNFLLLTVSASAAVGVIPSVMAQSTGAMLEEVVVTSRRYEENLQDAPVAVNAMSADFLQEQGIDTVTEVLLNSPGASFTQFNKMQAEYGMRGVSSQTEGASGDSSVSTIIDNVVVSKDFMKNPAFFDMERVEVLRGPQGTAFGRNASSGLVHLVTAKPSDDFGGGLTMDMGSHGLFGVEAFVTGAISDTTAGRLAINVDSHDGYTTDTRTGDDLGGEENFSIRGSLLMNPSDTIQVYLKAEINEDDDDTPAIRKGRDCSIPFQDKGAGSVVGAPQPGWVDVGTFTDSCDPWETTISDRSFSEFYMDRELSNLTAEITWDMSDSVALTSVTAYLKGDSEYMIDAHGGPNNSMFQNTVNDAEMFSQELRIDNHGSDDAFRWVAGAYFMSDKHSRLDQNIFYAENAASGPPGGGGGTATGIPNPNGGWFRPETRDIKEGYGETDSMGLFTEITYDISDQLIVTAGLRYSKDEKDYSIAHYGYGWGGILEGLTDGTAAPCAFAPGADKFYCGTSDAPVGFQTPVTASDSWENVSGKLSLSYSIDDDKMIYGLFSQGYKTGGFQPEPRSPSAALESFDEETVDNVELGFKGDFGDSLRLNISAFYSEYDGLQMFLFKNTPSGEFTQIAENAAGVEITGVEGDFIWALTERLRVSGGFAVIDAELVNALIDTDGDQVAEDFSGTRPDNTVDFTGTLVISYDIPLDNGSLVHLRADWRGNSDVYDDIGEQAARRHDEYDVIGARATWISVDGEWNIALWGKNLSDEVYTVNVGPAQPNINQLNFAYGTPRTVGASVNYRF
jgi:iron complex outermembrane receptor protein